MKTFYKKPAFAVIAAAMFVANFVGVSVGYADDDYFFCTAASANSERGFVSDVMTSSFYVASYLELDFRDHLEDEYDVDISNVGCSSFPNRSDNYAQMRDHREFYRNDLNYSVTEVSEYEWDGK